MANAARVGMVRLRTLTIKNIDNTNINYNQYGGVNSGILFCQMDKIKVDSLPSGGRAAAG